MRRSTCFSSASGNPAPSLPRMSADGCCEVHLEQRPPAARHERARLDARRSKRAQHVGDLAARDGQSERASHRSAQRLPAKRVRRRCRSDERRRAGGFGRAHDAADVSRILNVVRDDDERVARRQRVGQRRQRTPRDADDAGRRSHRAHRLERLPRDDEDIGAVCQELLRELLRLGIVEGVLVEGRAFDRQSRFVRLEQEVWTVEQQLAFESVCGGVASKLAIAFDAGVRRSSHLESIADVLGSSIG